MTQIMLNSMKLVLFASAISAQLSNNLVKTCYTGLTDEMRNDFNMMKELAVHTRVDPKARNDSLLRFIGDICRYVLQTSLSLLLSPAVCLSIYKLAQCEYPSCSFYYLGNCNCSNFVSIRGGKGIGMGRNKP